MQQVHLGYNNNVVTQLDRVVKERMACLLSLIGELGRLGYHVTALQDIGKIAIGILCVVLVTRL